jgi:hypothetical protein
MDLNEQIFKLLGGARRLESDEQTETLTLEELKKHDHGKVVAHAVKAAANTIDLVERYQPDCEYLAQLATANGYVEFLAGIGIVTEAFAEQFAKAVDQNLSIAMTKMTSEERQRELVMGEEQYTYLVGAGASASANEPAKRVAGDDLSHLFVTPQRARNRAQYESESDDDDDGLEDVPDVPMTPVFKKPGVREVKTAMQAPGDADEEAVSRYDQGPGLYDGLTEMGRWVTANDLRDDLLSKDRWLSFVRMVTGTFTGATLLSAGTIVVVSALDMIPWPVRAGMVGLGGLGLRYAARRGQSGARTEARARGGDFGAFTATLIVQGGQQVLTDLIMAYQVTLRPARVGGGPLAWLSEQIARYAGPYFARIPWGIGERMGDPGIALGEVRLSNTSGVAPYAKRVLETPWMRTLVTTLAANRHFLAGATVAGSLFYYFIPHHATKYVPNRQKYYLGINSAKTFKRLKKDRDDELKNINDLIGLIRPGPDVAADPGDPAAVRAAALEARRARNLEHAQLNARRVGISNRLARILRDREAVTKDPTPAAVIAPQPFQPAPPGAPPPVLPPCPRNPRGPGAREGAPDYEKACCDVEALVVRYRVVCVEIEQLELDVRGSLAANNIQINSCYGNVSVVDEVFAKLRL